MQLKHTFPVLVQVHGELVAVPDGLHDVVDVAGVADVVEKLGSVAQAVVQTRVWAVPHGDHDGVGWELLFALRGVEHDRRVLHRVNR